MTLLANLDEKGLKLLHALRMFVSHIVSLPKVDPEIAELDRSLNHPLNEGRKRSICPHFARKHRRTGYIVHIHSCYFFAPPFSCSSSSR